MCACVCRSQPQRVGAAYGLARAGAAGVDALERGVNDLREEVRRAATWGLSSPAGLPSDLATPVLLRAATAGTAAGVPALPNAVSVRKHAAFALGEHGSPTAASCAVLTTMLLTDKSTWVRTAAAGALGCLGIRAAAAADAGEAGNSEAAAVVCDAVSALVESLSQEVNRDYSGPGSWNGHNNDLNNRAWDGTHQLTGDHPFIIDMCEGFGPLRSAVRENALWAMVMLSKHYARLSPESESGSAQLQETAAALSYLVQTDANGYAAGHAMDALRRLAAAALEAKGTRYTLCAAIRRDACLRCHPAFHSIPQHSLAWRALALALDWLHEITHDVNVLRAGERGPLERLQRAMAAPAINPCPESLLRTKLPWEEERELIQTIGQRSDGAIGRYQYQAQHSHDDDDAVEEMAQQRAGWEWDWEDLLRLPPAAAAAAAK